MLLCCSKEGTKVDGAWLWCWKPSHAGSPCLEGSPQLWAVPKATVSGAQTSALSSACLVLKGQQKDLRRTGMATSAGVPCADPVLWKLRQDLAHNFGSSCLTLLLTLDQMWGWGLLWEPFLTLASCSRGELSWGSWFGSFSSSIRLVMCFRAVRWCGK